MMHLPTPDIFVLWFIQSYSHVPQKNGPNKEKYLPFICTPSKNIWTHLREPHEVSIKLENQNGSLFNMKCTKFFYKWACARRNVFPLENGACATFEPLARTPSKCVNPFICTPLRIDHIRVYKVMWPPKFALTARMISFVPRTIAKTVPSFRKHSNPLREI